MKENRIIRLDKLFIHGILALFLTLLIMHSADAYHWACLTNGQTTGFSTCPEQYCLLCVNEQGYSTDFAYCSNQIQCNWEGSGGAGTTTVPQVTITSPTNTNTYSQNRLTLTFNVDIAVRRIYYKIDSTTIPQITVCLNNCQQSYSFSIPATDSLSEGIHTIYVYAESPEAKTGSNSVSFTVDTILPVINSTLPRGGSYIYGNTTDKYIVEYSESNIKQVELYYKQISAASYTAKNITGCPAGQNKQCITTLDLHTFSKGTKIQYYFKLQDYINSVQSAVNTLTIDAETANPDDDYDSVLDTSDNCPSLSNPNQEDIDGDGKGDVCDNCPSLSNPNQGDRDGDRIGDLCDQYPDDFDNDGVDNNEDNIIGKSTDIKTETINPSLRVGNNINPDQATGTQEVEIENDGKVIVMFNFNFGARKLNLSQITIDTQKGNIGSLLIKGIDLGTGTKTVYVDRLNPSSNSICVKDEEISSINEISSNCNSANEYLVNCDGQLHNNYNCTIVSTKYRVSGLHHSGVKEQSACIENWQCQGWGGCQASGTQTRSCTDQNSCGTTVNKPSESQGCTYSTGGGSSGSSGGGSSGGGSSGGGSRGGGGGGGASLVASETQFISVIEPGTAASVKITDSDKLIITEVLITVTNKTTDSKITIKEATLPYGVNPPLDNNTGAVYKYLQITRSNIPAEALDSVVFNFKIKNDWFGKNNHTSADIILTRYLETEKRWQFLTTKKLREDSTYTYYSAESPGFSTFAVIAEKTQRPLETTKTTAQKNQTTQPSLNTTQNSNLSNQTKKMGTGLTGMSILEIPKSPIFIGAVVFVVVILVFVIVIKTTGGRSIELR